MVDIRINETFKEMDVHLSLKRKYAISNHGRLISYTKTFKDGSVLNGVLVNGYIVVNYKWRNSIGEEFSGHWMRSHLVGILFCEKESDLHIRLIHIDYYKKNDFAKNLKWVTESEWIEHQKKNPKNIAYHKREASVTRNGAKLNGTKVMRIKKKLAEKKLTKANIAKQHKVSPMQIRRIETGENWKQIIYNE